MKSAPLIYLIDNNLADLEVMQEMLPQFGLAATFKTFTDGKEAMKSLEHEEPTRLPDLILIDLHLAGVHGTQMLVFIKGRENLRKIPTIMITGSRKEELRALSMGLGADDLLIKPMSVQGYRAIAESLCSRLMPS